MLNALLSYDEVDYKLDSIHQFLPDLGTQSLELQSRKVLKDPELIVKLNRA